MPNDKILLFESSSGFGGSANSLANLANHLDRDRFTPIVLLSNRGPKTDRIANAEVIEFKASLEPSALSHRALALYAVKNYLPQAWRVFRLIKKRHLALVHVNTNVTLGIPAILAAKLAGIPVVCHIRETRPLIRRELLFAKYVSAFIVLSQKALETYSAQLPSARFTIIYNGVDLRAFAQRGASAGFSDGTPADRPSDAPSLAIRADDSARVGVVGRVVKGKGQIEFVLAAKRVLSRRPKTTFLVVGGARGEGEEYYREVVELVKKEGLTDSVVFTGWCDDVVGATASLDILVLSSTTFPEGLPNSIIEAMALRKPVVSTDIPGASEAVVDKVTGFLIEPGDVQQMADKVTYLLEHPEEARRMGEAGRKRIEELFDVKKTVKNVEAVYRALLSK